jgi:predicted 3-demethylubiquinone-9 3-methyltransferase (glyoxalase superfamily)
MRKENVMATLSKIAPCLWFDDQGEEAAKFYVSIFQNSKIKTMALYGKAGHEVHKKRAGAVMTVSFTLDGQDFLALNGGPQFKFSEAISLMVRRADQKEIDYYWDKLSLGGDPDAQVCGWLKDKYGLSWQIVPDDLNEYLTGDPAKSQRAFAAIMGMKKLDIAAIHRAYNGEVS